MSKTQEVTLTTANECARHALRLSKLANSLEYHIGEFNEMLSALQPFAARIKRSLVQYNEAIESANEFLESAGRDDLRIPRFSVVVPSAIQYNAMALDSACQTVSSLVDD